ncbi:hypothetical protein PC39_10382 [Salinisphaera sp. PC39]|uniref:hypothetical protein n=1 Tax=Salinisphaera sp. PC39 TaxID=1304156 RepID=UPI0033414139
MQRESNDKQPQDDADRGSASWWPRYRVSLTLAAAVAIGLALGWDWLAATGLLGIVLILLACLAMCAIAMRGGSGGRDSGG